jgi:hypothetical protein
MENYGLLQKRGYGRLMILRNLIVTLIFINSAIIAQVITIDSAFARGDSCINTVWYAESINTRNEWYAANGTLCKDADTNYKRCDFIPNQYYHGVAYSYGGDDNWIEFQGKIKSGYLAGSHSCIYDYLNSISKNISDYVAGTDCSALLSFLWGISRISTRIFLTDTRFQKINVNDIRPGDALVKADATNGYHAVFIAEVDGLSQVLIWEASAAVSGCRERVVDLNENYWKAFTPLRYPKLTGIVSDATISLKSKCYEMTKKDNNRIDLRSFEPTDLRIDFISLNGKQIYSTTISPYGKKSLSFGTGEANGIYLVNISVESRRLYSEKILIK